MRSKAIHVLCAIALIAGCKQQQDAGAGNELMPSAETRTGAAGDVAATSAAAPLGAAVSGEEAKRLMHVRHEGMEDIGDSTKVISRELKADSPDLAKIRQSAGTIARLAPQVTGWFPPGTGPDVGKTRAKAEIWQKPQDFATKSNDFVRAAEDFDSAAKSGDLGQIEASFAALGKSCKACHDSYREPEKD